LENGYKVSKPRYLLEAGYFKIVVTMLQWWQFPNATVNGPPFMHVKVLAGVWRLPSLLWGLGTNKRGYHHGD
jgi:hypothetical protein